MKIQRKIVQMSVFPETGDRWGYTQVLCDDGSIWWKKYRAETWQELKTQGEGGIPPREAETQETNTPFSCNGHIDGLNTTGQ